MARSTDCEYVNRARKDTKMKTLVIATCALALTIPSFGAASDGLVAHYKFDGNADDSSANKNNGIVQGAMLTTDRFGNADSAYSFDGNKWIEVPNSASLQSVTNTMTFSAWVNPTSTDHSWISLLCKGVAKRQLGFVLQHDKIWINNGGGYLPLPARTLDINIWYHVAVSYDGKTMKGYINGQCVGSVIIKDDPDINTTALYIGMDPPGVNEFMRGSIDEIRIYNRILSDKEIADIYMQESHNQPSARPRRLLGKARN